MTTQKLNKETVNSRLADRGIELVGEYANNRTKTTFRCGEGHTWEATPANVMRGKGCPTCAGNIVLNKEIVNSRLADRDIELVGEYFNNVTKTSFRCGEGHTWESRPANVINGSGCPHCSGQVPLTKEIVNDRLAADGRGIVLVGEYAGLGTKTAFRCGEGHTWEAIPNSVLQRSGCPHCATYGFNHGKPTEFYYGFVDTQDGGKAFLIGITNRTFEDRYQAGDYKHIKLEGRIQFPVGALALSYESYFKTKYAHLLSSAKTKLSSKGNTTNSTEIFSTNIIALEAAEFK